MRVRRSLGAIGIPLVLGTGVASAFAYSWSTPTAAAPAVVAVSVAAPTTTVAPTTTTIAPTTTTTIAPTTTTMAPTTTVAPTTVAPKPRSQTAAPKPAPKPVAAAPLPTANVAASCTTMVNAERAKVGLAPVTLNSRVQAAAQGHSNYQASINTMTHVSANGWHAGDRLHAAGYTWHTWGENVAAGQSGCTSVMSAWMASPGHKANILNPAFVNIGVAMTKSASGVPYWTMDFGTP